ncbi:ABC transporter substrate-binding protein, partial [Streptomyces sp. NPDC058678]
MTSLPSRRRLLATGAGAALGLGALGATASPATAAPAAAAHGLGAGAEETRTLDELYQAAIAEGGKLVIYAGGD